MARDGIRMTLSGGKQLDMKLVKLANLKQSRASFAANKALQKGAAEVRKTIRSVIPKSQDGASGFKKYESRNHPKGSLRRSVKSGLLKKVNVGRSTFLAGVYITSGTGVGKLKSKGARDDGWYAPFVMGDRHAPNAYGFMGGYNVLDRGVKMSSKKFISTVGRQISKGVEDEARKLGIR